MNLATRSLLAAVAFVLVAGSASAQNDVTFQVNLQPFIDSCQFDPETDAVQVRGSFNEFGDTTPLADADGDGVYTTTVSLTEGNVSYKFWASSETLTWEDNVNDGGASADNRDYVVTAGAQTIPVVDFNKTIANQCAGAETYDVTFQVDMRSFVQSCQFDPETDVVQIRGTFNGYTDRDTLVNNGENIYTKTLALPEGNVSYKYWASPQGLTWENNVSDGGANANDRDYIVTTAAEQTVPVATYNKPVANACGQTTKTYEIDFVIDMGVQISRGAFDPETQVVAVGSDFTGWDAGTALVLSAESDNPTVFSGTVTADFDVPSETNSFKFITLNLDANGDPTGPIGYEQPNADVTQTLGGNNGGNRILALSGNEPVDGSTGNLFLTYDNDANEATPVYFSDQDADGLIAAEATVTYNIDLRPAYYALLDGETIPTGVSSIDGVYLNGPVIGESSQQGGPGEGEDWPGWGEALRGIEARKLTANGDSTFSITLTYPVGALETLIGKFSVNGFDNEAGFDNNHEISLQPGAQTYNLVFGAMRKGDGSFRDQTIDGNGTVTFDLYDPYIDLGSGTPSVVRSGGATSSESGPGIRGLAISAAYPNPSAGRTALDLVLDRPMDLTVRVYDVTGRLVTTLAQGPRPAGEATVSLETSALSAGLYLVRVDADGQTVTRRFSVLR